MAMKGERMKDAGDGDGEGGGEISTSSNSDLELEEKEILTEKDMREKESRQKKTRGKGMLNKMWKKLKLKEKVMWEKEEQTWVSERERVMETLVRENEMMRESIRETEEMLMREKKMMRETEEMLVREKKMMREKEEMLVKEMEMLVNEKEKEKEIWKEMWKKMKEKEPKPLQDWEMGMEKCPCLLGWCRERKGPVLYFFNLLDERKSNIREYKKDEDGKRPGTQVITLAESITLPKYYNMSVVVGSVLYVLGGGALEHPENEQDPENEQEDPENEQESFYNDVFLCDTNHPQKRWIKGPDMLNHRCNGKAVAVESKIYVFGGNNKMVEDRPWAEFLDPDKNKWEPLPAPPADSLIHTRDLLYNPVVFYGSPGKGKIFLSCCYYIYDVNDQTWEEFCPPESLRPFSHNVTSDGNILYWSTFGHLYSFDMKTQVIDCGLVEGYKISKYREELLFPEPTLLHLDGDYFCFITLKDLPEDCTKVRCTKFQVSHQGGLKASVVYRDTYTIDCPLDIDCSYAFVLNGKLRAEKSEGSSVF